MSQDAQVNTWYNVNCERRTRAHDAARHRGKHPRAAHPLAKPLTKRRFTGNMVVAYDGTGDYVQLQNGLDIYLTTNTDDPVAVWTTAGSYACATGPITVDDLKTFILSIQ